MLGCKLFKRALADKPRLNARICEGLAYHQASSYEGYIDAVLRAASTSWPEGHKYIGCRRATPLEQLTEETRTKRQKRLFETAANDLYLMVYILEFNGERLKPRYMLLPYIRPGGLMRLRGASYDISPVLADNIFSVGLDKIYMPVTRSKLYFHKLHVKFLADRETVSINTVHSPIDNVDKSERNTKRDSLLIHYILCKRGLVGGLKHYFNIDVNVGHGDITTATHPTDQWVICESTGIPPKGHRNYYPSTFRIAIPRDQVSTVTLSIIGGIFYIVDHEPELVVAEESENILMWRRLLPRFILKTVTSEKKAAEKMERHFDSLDHYMDELVRMKLQHEGIPNEDIFALFGHILTTFEDRTTFADPANMGDKQLETTRFVLYNIVASVFNMTFTLAKLSGDRLNKRKIEQVMDTMFKSDAIFQLTKGHGEISTTNSPTDLLLSSITSGLIMQHRTTVSRNPGKNNEMSDPAYALHKTQAAVSGFILIRKSQPSGRGDVNHFMELTDRDEVVIPERFKDELDALEAAIGVD